jgi:hypothetical protein
LIQGFKPHIAFTWNEEVGGLGARFLSDNLNPKQFDLFAGEHGPINFAIQFDRRGHQQAVYYDLDNQDFEDYISAFGFKTEWGSYTDICEICPAWGFAGVNLSAGYINEHTSSELILVETLEDTLAKAARILEDQIENPTFFEYKEHARVPYKMPAAGTTYHYNQDYYYGDPDDPDYGYGKWSTSGSYSYGGYDDDLDADVPPSTMQKMMHYILALIVVLHNLGTTLKKTLTMKIYVFHAMTIFMAKERHQLLKHQCKNYMLGDMLCEFFN